MRTEPPFRASASGFAPLPAAQAMLCFGAKRRSVSCLSSTALMEWWA